MVLVHTHTCTTFCGTPVAVFYFVNSGGRGAVFVGGLLAAFDLGGLCGTCMFVGGHGAVFVGGLLAASVL